MAEHDDDRELNDYERRLIDNIAEYGWQCTMVDGEFQGTPDFAYSIGLWETLGSPELIMFGLDRSLMKDLLWDMFRQIKAGAELTDGRRWKEIIRDYDCISRPVHPTQVRVAFLNSAMWYRRYRGVEKPLLVFQLFWPDLEGIFPWEKGCDPFVRECQPALYLPLETGLA